MIPMNSSQLPPPQLIQDEDALHTMENILRSQAHVAVDTESNSLYAYQEQVCLIQFSIQDADYLVDPLAISNLEPLAPFFADPEIEKILHGAEYDIMCLKRDFGFKVSNLFDTRLASRTLGRQRTGLSGLLAEEFGIEIDKRFQRADWGKRPIIQEMLHYARLDTYHLIALRHRLFEALSASDRLEETLEACEYMTSVTPQDNGFNPEGYWQIRNSRKLKPRQIAILRELYLFRDTHARRLNRPPFKVMSDASLMAIAQEAPKNLEALSLLPGMTAGQIRRYGRELLEAVERSRHTPLPHRPSGNTIDDAVQARYEALHSWRKITAKARKVDSDIILPRDVLWRIAKNDPQDLNTLKRLMSPLDWRFRTHGREILQVLQF
jgi:ribonuclease D